MAVQNAHSPGGALHVLRHQRGTRLPIDIPTTHHPTPTGAAGFCLTSLSAPRAGAASRRAAAALGSGRRMCSAGARPRTVPA